VYLHTCPLLLSCQDNFRKALFNTDDLDEALDLLDFNYKIVARSGLAEVGTYLPKAINPRYNLVPQTTSPPALEEAHLVMTGAVEGLMKKQGEQLQAADGQQQPQMQQKWLQQQQQQRRQSGHSSSTIPAAAT
jgi:hypothetical protein